MRLPRVLERLFRQQRPSPPPPMARDARLLEMYKHTDHVTASVMRAERARRFAEVNEIRRLEQAEGERP